VLIFRKVGMTNVPVYYTEPSMKDILLPLLTDALQYTPTHRAVVIYDTDSPLARVLSEGYRAALPQAQHLHFPDHTPDFLRASVAALSPGDLVVLVQSSSFRLNEFRFRVELFKLGLAVIEHPHLGRMPEREIATYLEALRYDKDYYQTTGRALATRIRGAQEIIVQTSGGNSLHYLAPFEDPKLNIGDYTGMKNVGGQFPIGEVFTEPVDFAHVNGTVALMAFGDTSFRTCAPETPIVLTITEGRIVGTEHSTEHFLGILEQLRQDGELFVRELGFGLNRALTKKARLSDVGGYERMCGVHLSLGAKHAMYAKPGLSKRAGRYHVDVFADVERVLIDGSVVYEGGVWTIS
jgi:hypothetical protein